MVRAKRTIFFDLIATSKKRQYYTFSTWSSVKEGDDYSVKIDVSVNGKTPDSKHIFMIPIYTENERRERVKVSLKGSLKYKICIKEEKIYNINSDFVVGFKAKHITNNLRVQIIHPKDINTIFVSCGTQSEFQAVNNSEIINEYWFNHVLLPKQGFCIALNPTNYNNH